MNQGETWMGSEGNSVEQEKFGKDGISTKVKS